MKNLLKLCLPLLAIGAVALANAVAFSNGGFDSGDWTDWDVALTENGDVGFQDIVSFDMNFEEPGGVSTVAQFSVGQDDDDGPLGGIRITQALVLEAGVTYTISYKWAARNTFPVFDNLDGGTFQIVANDQVLTKHATENVPTMVTEYGTLTAQFTPITTGEYAVGGQIVRRFRVPFFSELVMAQYVDDFEINAVPEPTTLSILAVAGVALLRKRRRHVML